LDSGHADPELAGAGLFTTRKGALSSPIVSLSVRIGLEGSGWTMAIVLMVDGTGLAGLAAEIGVISFLKGVSSCFCVSSECFNARSYSKNKEGSRLCVSACTLIVSKNNDMGNQALTIQPPLYLSLRLL
jgi:hypothetical protein